MRDYTLTGGNGSLPRWTPEQALAAARSILPGEWTVTGEKAFHECPGAGRHTTGSGAKDFALFLRGNVPAATCFHTNCYDAVLAFNKELYRRLFGWKRVGEAVAAGGFKRVKEVVKKRQDFDLAALKAEQAPDLLVNKEWLAARSPLDPRGMGPTQFLEALYEPGERVLAFTSQWSQGEYGYVVGPEGGWRGLGRHRGEKSIDLGWEQPAELKVAPEGVWFLAQPVDGKWHLDPDRIDKQTGLPGYSRRSKLAVTAWRWMVLESDSAPVDLWLNFLAQLKLRIGALFTSGGRSVHALVRIDAQSKAAWDMARDLVTPILSRLGADPAAITAVRLTRLPGCRRAGKRRVEKWVDEATGEERRETKYHKFPEPLLQELLWLDPQPEPRGLINYPIRRTVHGARE